MRNKRRYMHSKNGMVKIEINRYSILESSHFLHLSKTNATRGEAIKEYQGAGVKGSR